MKTHRRQKDNIFMLFKKLCRWGRHSGVPRQKFQTPLEYGLRLIYFFPDSTQDIELIVNSFNKKIYGKKIDDMEEFKKIKKAWRRLSSPSKWPLRLMTKIFYSKKLVLAKITTFYHP